MFASIATIVCRVVHLCCHCCNYIKLHLANPIGRWLVCPLEWLINSSCKEGNQTIIHVKTELGAVGRQRQARRNQGGVWINVPIKVEEKNSQIGGNLDLVSFEERERNEKWMDKYEDK